LEQKHNRIGSGERVGFLKYQNPAGMWKSPNGYWSDTFVKKKKKKKLLRIPQLVKTEVAPPFSILHYSSGNGPAGCS
jgi:hypothetical protein